VVYPVPPFFATLDAREVPGGVRLEIATNRVPENVMVWADGRFVVQLSDNGADPPYRGHTWPRGRKQNNVTLNRALLHIEPGAEFRAAVWTAAREARFTSAAVVSGGSPAPFVLPTVATGRATRPTIRTLFNCPPSVAVADKLADDLHAAGINVLSVGAFLNPADNGTITTLQQWRAAMDQVVQPQLDWCEANGFGVLALGDDFIRFQGERDWLVNSPWAADAVRETAARFAAAGCVGLEVADEVSPTPADYGQAAVNLVQWWREGGGGPIAWPVEARNLPPYPWEVPEWSGYSSRYWTDQEWATGNPGRVRTAWQILNGIRRSATGLPAWHWLSLTGVTGTHYKKLAPGGDYQPGVDELHGGAWRPQDIITQVWVALAYGASGFRCYGYDFPLWRNQRRDAPVGTPLLQTGAKPGDERWAALAVAMNSVKDRDAALDAAPYEPVESGPWLFGRRGGLVWGVNCAERALPSPNGPGVVIDPAGESSGSTVPGGCAIVWG
jgi:hypothetical protein